MKAQEAFRAYQKQERGTQPPAHEQQREPQKARHASMDERTKEGATRPDAAAFREQLDERGLAFAVVSKDEAYRTHREAAFAKEIGRKGAVLTEGEIVLVSGPPLERLRAGEWKAAPRVHRLDQDTAQTYLAFLSIDKSKLKTIEATRAALDASAAQRAAYWRDIRLERATDLDDRAQVRAARAKLSGLVRKAPARAMGAAFNIGTELAGLFFSAFDTPKSPWQQARDNLEGERATDRTNYQAEIAQERKNQQERQAARDRERGERDR